MNDHQRPDVTVRRAYQIYLYSVCFVTIIVVLFAGGLAVYGLTKVLIPGALSEGGHNVIRKQGAAEMLQSGILAAVAFVIFIQHWRRAADVRAELERALLTPPPSPEPAVVLQSETPASSTRAPRKRTPPQS
jgi:hypothetical protein